ncbi:MAG: PAS domain S-box protein [Dehalococcoidales bacterium]|nr:PAS domain S-box protein [Dehalococcoidales bacterium]
MDKAKKQSPQQFNKVLDMLPVYLVLLTPDYYIQFANRFFRERFGDVVGKTCYESLFKRTKPCEKCQTFKVLQTDKPLQWDWVGPDKHYYSIYDFPYIQADGSRLIMEVGIDVTKEKRTQEALRKAHNSLEARVQERTKELQETRDYLDNLFNYANAPIIVWNPEFKITRFNHAFERLTRLTAAEVLGRKLDVLFPENNRETSMELIRNLVKGERWEVVEIPILRADGTVRTVLWNSANIYADDGITLVAIIAQGQDITTLKDTQGKLLSYERLATIGKVSGSIAHEIRNPLAIIDSSLFYLEKILPDTDERVKTHLSRISSATRQCASVIEALLKMTHPDELRLGSVDLQKFIDVILSEYCPVGITTVNDFLSETITIKGDQEQLRIAFGNIIRNAVQAMNGRGTLTIAIRTNRDNVDISIGDTGPGIPPENIEKIFEPLFSTKAKGVGLGLSIAKSIVELHDGKITATSELGEGAVFTVRFPLSQTNRS